MRILIYYLGIPMTEYLYSMLVRILIYVHLPGCSIEQQPVLDYSLLVDTPSTLGSVYFICSS